MIPSFIAILMTCQCLILGSVITLATFGEDEFYESEHFWKESWIMWLLIFILYQCVTIVYLKQGL